MNIKLPNVRIGANPIIWSNDDFQDLGGDIPLERCLQEMQQAKQDMSPRDGAPGGH